MKISFHFTHNQQGKRETTVREDWHSEKAGSVLIMSRCDEGEDERDDGSCVCASLEGLMCHSNTTHRLRPNGGANERDDVVNNRQALFG